MHLNRSSMSFFGTHAKSSVRKAKLLLPGLIRLYYEYLPFSTLYFWFLLPQDFKNLNTIRVFSIFKALRGLNQVLYEFGKQVAHVLANTNVLPCLNVFESRENANKYKLRVGV
ncbi:MAG: hypothetical protein QXZ41_07645 [Ignisphaera sp.]